jgi:hypothetical protein
MALTKLDPNVIGQDSTGAGKITSAGGSVSIDSSGNVRIANATANSVTVTANGTVGIGTVTPSAKLHVAKSSGNGYAAYILSTVNVSGSDNGLFIGGSDENSGSALLNIQSNVTDLNSTSYHTRFLVSANGTVQVGDNPNGYTGGYLRVHNPSGGNASTRAELSDNAILLLQPHATNSTHMAFGQVNGGAGMGIQVTNYNKTADWDIALNPFGGRVGVGTVSPSYKLHVAGEVYAGGTQEFIGKYFHTTSNYYTYSTSGRRTEKLCQPYTPIKHMLLVTWQCR